MTTFNYEDPADPGVHKPKVIGAPREIWLCYGDLPHDDTHENCYRDGEVTWCQDPQFASDIRYVRADLFEAVAAQPKPAPDVEEIARLREIARTVNQGEFNNWPPEILRRLESLSLAHLGYGDATPQKPAPVLLTDDEIEQGRHDTFSTSNQERPGE